MFSIGVAMALGSTMVKVERSWEAEVIYQIFPRSFRDSNGDQIGDFRGIVEGLPAIQKLGATTILLNPVCSSRNYHNYFADDWFSPDPEFGTMADFRALCRAAHKRGIKVVLDMEPQYTTEKHPWYVATQKDPNSKEAGYYFGLTPDDPFGKITWWDKTTFPLLTVNLNSEGARHEIARSFLFWRKQGVDGFRIDHMMDDLDNKHKNKGLLGKLWKPLEEEVTREYPGTWFIGEQADWSSGSAIKDIFSQTPTDAVFNFWLFSALLSLKKVDVEKALTGSAAVPPAGRTQANFMELHDLDRFSSKVTDIRKQKAAAALLFAAKGTPLVYYGQELGMKGLKGNWGSDGNDIPARLAYRWGARLDSKGTARWYAGTGPWDSTANSADHDGISYAEEDNDPNSLLNWYRLLIKARTRSQALSHGDIRMVDHEGETTVFTRGIGASQVWVVANLSDQAVPMPHLPSVAKKELISGYKPPKSLAPWQVVYLK
ncbi:MAG: alpha-amylase family glycosyl hydrolase [Armatimonadota bacterium]